MPDHQNMNGHRIDEQDLPRQQLDTDADADTTRGYINDKATYLSRLRRIEGQARGIHKMVAEEKYCIDILTQISAMNSALENVALGLLKDHLHHCVAHAATAHELADHSAAEDERSEDLAAAALEEKINEAAEAIRRLVKS